MDDIEKKLTVLSKIARVLNNNNIIWAVGGSLLLYLKNKVELFNDIDIMVHENDAEKLKTLLLKLGVLSAANPNQQYKTRCFMEFTIDNVDVDVMAGFVIVCSDKEYDCSLQQEQIAEYIYVNEEKIPLQSLVDWRRYYELMGRDSRVEQIDR